MEKTYIFRHNWHDSAWFLLSEFYAVMWEGNVLPAQLLQKWLHHMQGNVMKFFSANGFVWFCEIFFLRLTWFERDFLDLESLPRSQEWLGIGSENPVSNSIKGGKTVLICWSRSAQRKCTYFICSFQKPEHMNHVLHPFNFTPYHWSWRNDSSNK